MYKRNEKIIYSPSDLIVYMESEFASWMNRFYLEFPDQVEPDEDDEGMVVLQTKGTEHEKAFVEKLHQEGRQVVEIPSSGDAYTATKEKMQEKASIIYQAALRSGDFAGYADFLALADGDGESLLGNYHYEVWDTKLALKPKPYFLIQLCCYAEMLEEIQGKRPDVVRVVLGNGEIRAFRTDDYFYFYSQLKKAFLEQQRTFDPEKRPVPDGMANHGRWSTLADEILEETDHLSRVANIRKVAIKKLQNAGIGTMKALAATHELHVKNMLPSTLDTLKHQARLQVASAGEAKPRYELIQQEPADPRRGLALLPPASALDVCFDMEGYPHAEGGLEYLFGVTCSEDGKLQFKDWWGHDRTGERRAFEEFIDWVHARWEKDRSMHIYHYASYEVTAMRRLMGRYGTREREVDELLRNEVFVDLYTIVRQGMRVGEPKYSIKNIEHLYKEGRSGAVATAMDSVVMYQRWLECKDGEDWKTSKTLANIRDYNKEDCDSTWLLMEWLRELQGKEKIAWIPKRTVSDDGEDEERPSTPAAELAKELLDAIPEDRSDDPELWRLQELLAYLLEFHWRAEKPLHWAMFDRHAMTEDQLIDDIDCLGGLERTNRARTPVKESWGYEYKFNPEQETKLHAGDKCFFAHDLDVNTIIEELDMDKGLVTIKLGATALQLLNAVEPPGRLSLIPNEIVPARPIPGSIYGTVENWKKTGKLPGALNDFLMRRRPRIKGNPEGLIIPQGKDLIDGAIDAVANLDGSTLCIQGPPGSGKTYTAAHVIVALLKRNQKVGVTSNSHKAICKLMSEVASVAHKAGVGLNAVKIGGSAQDDLFAKTSVRYAPTSKKVFGNGPPTFQLIGGTAWAFSADDAAGSFDYLFVDEAGQVSVANLVGMAPSTKNIVLIGDQMQLGQPIQGSHPGESGKSLLDYLLGEHQVIPDDFGIFLGTSWRMHPQVCSFISGAVYEGRLLPQDETVNRVLILPGDGTWVKKNAGIIFIPVEHEDNAQSSDEEAAAINEIVKVLLRCRVKDKDGVSERPIVLDNVLLVAPYNMQVRKLQKLIPGARVGSVDKFQGQEAPVVIVSMCASSNEGNSRGLEFLFSKNRLNVAISRAQTLAIVVGNPALSYARCARVEQMELANLFCRIVQTGLATE